MGRLKRLFVFLVVLAVAIGGLLIWWQANAARVITDYVRGRALDLVVNPQNLTVELPKPVQMVGFREALVPAIIIKGQNLELRDGPVIKSATVKLTDVTVAGPPFGFTGLGQGQYTVNFTDAEVTKYLRARGVKIPAVAKIPLDTLTVKFTRKDGALMTGEWKAPLIGRIPLSVKGKLVPSSSNGEIDFKIASSKDVKISKYSIGVQPVITALEKLNPVVSISEWPFLSDITKITTGNGDITIHGKVTDL